MSTYWQSMALKAQTNHELWQANKKIGLLASKRYQCAECPAADSDWRTMAEHKAATEHVIRDIRRATS